MHTAGPEQSASDMQALRQAFAPQRKGKHEVALGVTQVPAPSHVDTAVDDVVPVAQEAPWQDVPETYFWQTPAWHLPFVPQLMGPWSTQRAAGSMAPVATLLQTPREPGSAQLRQAPSQAVWQQMPCAQNPLLHWAPASQVAPSSTRPQVLPLHWLGARHWLSAVHTPKHLLPLQT